MTTKGADLNVGDIHNLDRQIDILMDCKPLSETEVKALCEKVLIKIYLRSFKVSIFNTVQVKRKNG